MVDKFGFSCIASRPLDAVNDISGRRVTYIVIMLDYFDYPAELRENMKTNTIDWEAFLASVRKFPDLRQVVVQCRSIHDAISGAYLREILVEFVAHMRSDEWGILEGLLGLYHRIWEGEWSWVQIQLDNVMDDIKLKV